jgi:hypothetical protein
MPAFNPMSLFQGGDDDSLDLENDGMLGSPTGHGSNPPSITHIDTKLGLGSPSGQALLSGGKKKVQFNFTSIQKLKGSHDAKKAGRKSFKQDDLRSQSGMSSVTGTSFSAKAKKNIMPW